MTGPAQKGEPRRFRRFRRRVRPRFDGLSFNRLIPNIMTLLGLCAGLVAMRFALDGRWDRAASLIVVAAVIDGLDGRLARLLKATSRFGAEFDSLADFLSFGVAPAFILYLWALQGTTGIGFVPCLLFTVCMALRLARFNTDLDDVETPAWTRNYFTGMPSPAGAGTALLPLVLWLQLEADVFRSPGFVAVIVIGGAMLLVSRIRTFAFKRVKLPQRWVLPAMIGVGVYVAALLSDPWLTTTLTQVAYLASIPFSDRRFRRMQRLAARPADPGADG